MTEVINMPSDSLDQSPSASAPPPSAAANDDLPPPPHPSSRRRDRDSRDRRDDRDFDRHPNRRDYYDWNLSPAPRDRDRDFKRRRSPSPNYRDRRYSPPPPSRRSPPPYKRSRRGSPRGGAYGPDDRFGYDYSGGYERGVGGRAGYADEKSHGRFSHRSAGGYQNGISDMDTNRSYADLPSGGAKRSRGCQNSNSPLAINVNMKFGSKCTLQRPKYWTKSSKSPASTVDIRIEDTLTKEILERSYSSVMASKFLESDGGLLLLKNTKGLFGTSGKEGKAYRK